MTKIVFIVIINKLAKLETRILLFFTKYASITTIVTARKVIKYIRILMSSELFVFINLIIWGKPEITNNIAGR